MTLLQIIVLAIVQGLTEFLPVSSSAHLILVSKLFDWPDQGLALDVAVHLGTLLAVLVYFRHDLFGLLQAWREPADDPVTVQRRRIGVCIALGSLPVLIAGFLLYDLVAGVLRDVRVIALATIFFGVILLLADRFSPRSRDLTVMTLRDGVLIGLAQMLALIPGTSRSGATLTAGRLLGFTPRAAARFSFLLSIPVIALAGAHGVYKVLLVGGGLSWQPFLLAMLFAALAGWLCIAAFLAVLDRLGLMPFILYRLALGLLLLGVAL